MTPWGHSSGWLLKGLAAACLALATVPTGRLSALAYTRVNDPQAAHRLHPDDALAASTVLPTRFAEGIQFPVRPLDLRPALRSRPLTPELIATQGLSFDANGTSPKAFAMMQLTNRISRRTVVANLWLIETTSASGDLSSTIANYHAALTVHPELSRLLLPVLASALTYPEVRDTIKPYLAKPNRWIEALLDEAVRRAAIGDIVDLLQPLPRPLRNSGYQPQLAAILHRVAVELGRDSATKFAMQIIPGFIPETLKRLEVTPQSSDTRLGALAWNLFPSQGITIVVRDGRVLEVVLQPLSRGQIAVRELLVEGGHNYTFSQSVSFDADSSAPALHWSAACVSRSGASLFWTQHIQASRKPARYHNVLKVPKGCNVARLILNAVGPEGQLPTSAVVDELRLTQQPYVGKKSS